MWPYGRVRLEWVWLTWHICNLVDYSSQYKIHILTLAGDRLASFSPEPEPALGIREVAWHPTGMFLAVAGWDDKVYQQTFLRSRNDHLSRFTFSTVSAGHRSSPLSFQEIYLLRWSVSFRDVDQPNAHTGIRRSGGNLRDGWKQQRVEDSCRVRFTKWYDVLLPGRLHGWLRWKASRPANHYIEQGRPNQGESQDRCQSTRMESNWQSSPVPIRWTHFDNALEIALNSS